MGAHGWIRMRKLLPLFLVLLATPVWAEATTPVTPVPIVGQQGSVTRVVFSQHDGRWLAVADRNAITLWDVASGHLVATFDGHGKGIVDVAFSPDGAYLATSDGEGVVRLWELANSRLIRSFDAEFAHSFGSENAIAFSPDGQLLEVGYTLWDVKSGKLVRQLELDEHAPPRETMRSSDSDFSPDGRLIAIATGLWQVGVWDTQSGRPVRKITATPAGSEVLSVAFSPDGTLLATGSTDGLTQLWEAATGKLQRVMKRHRAAVSAVAFSPDGKRIASADHDWKIVIRDVSTGEHIRTLSGHNGPVYTVAFSPDGRYVASGGYDQTFHVWELETGKAAPQFEKEIDTVNQIAFSPDGQLFASGGLDGSVRIWDRKTAQMRQRLTGHVTAVQAIAFSGDGRHLVAGGADGTLRVWEQDDAGEWLPATSEIVAGSDPISAVAFLAADRQIVSGSHGGTVRIHDVAGGKLVRSFDAHDLGIASLAVSPKGDIATSGEDRIVKLWRAETGLLVQTLEGHEDVVPAVAFSPDGGLLASGSEDGTVRLWDNHRGQLVRKIESKGAGDGIYAVAFSHDGSLVAAGNRSGRVTFWNAATGAFAGSIEQVGGRISALVFSRDDHVIATATSSEYRNTHTPVARQGRSDATLKLWQVPQGMVRSWAAHDGPINALAATADGAVIASAGKDRSVKLWDPVSGELRTLFDEPLRPVKALAVAGKGHKIAAAGDDGIRLWDLGTGEAKYLIYQSSNRVNALALSADGSMLAVAGYDFMALCDTTTGQITERWQEQVRSLAFTPDGLWLVMLDKQGLVGIRDVATSRDVRIVSRDVAAMSLSADGHTLAIAVGNTGRAQRLELHDLESGHLIRSLDLSDGSAFKTDVKLALSPDGRLVAAATFSVTRIWESATGRLLHTLAKHENIGSDENQTLAFFAGPGGETRFLASAGGDGAIQISPLEREKPQVTLFAGRIADRDEWLAMTPEGFFDASAKGAEILTVVRGLEVYGIDQLYQALYRPDLVREKLAGDPNGKVKEAAAKLDLAKLIDSGSVPQIVITSHQPQDSSPVDLVTVEARLTDQGGAIGRAEWRINGITVGVVEQAGGAPGQPVTLRQTIALDPGENTIELVAYNGSNLVASIPARAKITWTGTEPTAPPRLYVLVVGINDYLDSALKLTYAVPDATALASALKEAGQNYYEDVIVTQALDRDATTAKLDAVFADLATKVRPRDIFMFFAAGHGKTYEGRYYFVPHDLHYHTEQSLVRDAIGQDRLQAWFARVPAKKAVLMFDTCEAGSLAEQRVGSRGLEQKAALGRLIQATGRATLTASTASQAAYEGYGGHGVFTFALLDALGRGDTNNNGLIELTELIQHVDGLVPAITEKRWGAKQYPQMDALGSNFSLVREVAALAPAQGDAIIIPVKPTHVTTELLQVFKEAGGIGKIVQQLPPFTTVTLVKSDRGWALIAKDGTVLGYAAEAKLHTVN
jgi:WD40 repeat protein